MDNKLLLQDLAEAIAIKEGLTKKKSEAFVKALFETIEEGLLSDKFVKIKGLGTFKIISVGERESVNINTGERFFIEGHERITFTPDTSLKELVNRPFAHFQTVIINDETNLEELESVDKDNSKESDSPDQINDNQIKAEDKEVDSGSENLVLPDSDATTSLPSTTDASNKSEATSSQLPPETEADEEESYKNSHSDNPDDTLEEERSLEHEENNHGDEKEGLSDKKEENTSTSPLTVQQEKDEQGIPEQTEHLEEEGNLPTTEQEDNDHENSSVVQDHNALETENVYDKPTSQESEATSAESQNPTDDTSTFKGLASVDDNEVTGNIPNDESQQQQIRYIIKELENKRNIWKTIAIALLSVLLLILSYFAGYFRWFCPCENTQPNVNPTVVCPPLPQASPIIAADSVAQLDSLNVDSNIVAHNNEDAVKEKAQTEKVNETVALKIKSPLVNPNTVTSDNEKSTDPESQYKQVPGGKYRIIGTKGTHRIQEGETIRTIALDVYKSKGYAEYIITHNNLENPNLISKGMVIKLPELERRKQH